MHNLDRYAFCGTYCVRFGGIIKKTVISTHSTEINWVVTHVYLTWSWLGSTEKGTIVAFFAQKVASHVLHSTGSVADCSRELSWQHRTRQLGFLKGQTGGGGEPLTKELWWKGGGGGKGVNLWLILILRGDTLVIMTLKSNFVISLQEWISLRLCFNF